MRVRKYAIGGMLASVGMSLLSNKLMELIGQIGQPSNQAIIKNSNPYGYGYGGKIVGSADAMKYKGKKHESGGIMVNKSGLPNSNPTEDNVEGDEMAIVVPGGVHIFSKRLKIKK